MDKTLAQPQVNLSLLRCNSLKFQSQEEIQTEYYSGTVTIDLVLVIVLVCTANNVF
jgi:hypothetical protein